MFKISDRVKETSTTNGTGSVTLTGPYSSFQSFSDAIGDGNTTYYAIENGIRWEVGQGTFDQGSNSLSRDIIFDSSDSGNKVVLDGNSTVFCTLPAAKAFITDPNGDVIASGFIGNSGVFDTLYVNTLIASGSVNFDGDNYFNNIFVSGELLNSGCTTFVRPASSSGNFFHAYKDDPFKRTIGLYMDGNPAPEWRIGLKQNPSDKSLPPDYAYLFGRDGVIGLVSDLQNYIHLSNSLGFIAYNNNNQIISAGDQNNISIEAFNNSQPSFIVTSPILASQDIQRWVDGSDTTLSVVDSGGRFGILTDAPEYDIDVSGSGRLDTIALTNGIYFPDGSFQSSAPGGPGGGAATFDNDLTVVLGGGKTFGRYGNGDTIPASGLTGPDVITLAVTEPLDPTVNLSASPTTIETGTIAVSVSLTFSYIINNPGASVSTVSLEYRRGGAGSWTVLSTDTGLTSYVHNFANASADQINYRYVVTDDQGSTATATRNVSFDYNIFYGPSSSVPTTSAAVRSLPSSRFAGAGNTFNLNTGSTEVNFTVAMPDTETISEVLDLDALNANITSEYINNPFNVDDAGGTPVGYNVYTMTIAIPYSSNHRHQVTKG